MNNKLEVSDIKLIIRNLITFIVLDGKEYVSDQRKQEYVAAYIHLLVKTMNLVDNKEESAIIEDIANDIDTYLE
ncbi:hypothetical protein [Aquimarina sp. 2201CG5-10]|uniref:hypothetical protein n=1 Tax=Aquimarina callyspongiae TaxID=3098150 RepID=UPI002AB4E14B|nr:hypothetical protein [Aquimarina sp. 2201CG5-10]MDY8136599.1 hypothetical protein [Aquimarina sp. 2201CG5-10]